MRHRLTTTTFALATLALPLGAQGIDAHAGHVMEQGSAARQPSPDDRSLPAGAATVAQRLAASPRHGEWVMIARPGSSDSLKAWVVYPERKDKAPVVVVIHEIFGLSTWIRGVADQLAAEGFIAIAPDMLSGVVPQTATDTIGVQAAMAAIRTLKPADVTRDVHLAAEYAMKLPAALPRFGVVGFCWGGSQSYATAVAANAKLRGAVVYYGAAPASDQLASVKAPILGLFGENDARVNATIPAADSTLKAMGRRFEPAIFAGAGHGFLRQQDGQNGANLAATKQAWPKTVAFFRDVLRR